MSLHKIRFVVTMWGDCFWSTSFHGFRDFLVRHAVDSGYDMATEGAFRPLAGRPKWLMKPWGEDGDLESTRIDLPFNGFIEPLDWTEKEFGEALIELDAWHASQIKAAS
jgi:hypothetical protein